jgi:hypothetical protein
MIETDFFILNGEQYQEYYTEATKVGVTLDYYLMEFTDTEGPDVVYDGENWVEISE